MSRPSRYDILFEPIEIGPRTMKNRFYQTPHCTGFGDVFPGGNAHHRAMKAEGGWAVVNTEATTIAPEYDWAGQMTNSRIWDDDDVRNWSLLVEKAHEHGALAGIQLHAGGGFLTAFDSRMPGRHVSDRLEEGGWLGSVIKMDKRDIREVQRQYVAAAQRAKRAGFDIINVWGGESAPLPVQFLMNLHNDRTDEYGGPLENRARFWLETLEQVKEEVDDIVLAARFCIDSLHGDDRGIRVDEEGVGFIELADHLVDFWDVQVGGEHAELWIKDAGPSRFYPENFQAEYVKKIRPHTKKPIIGVGRFTSPDVMVEVIKSGQQDIIGAARPSIADPFIPRKIEEGRFDDIRECIGCNVCVSRVNANWHLICTQNSAAGEEYRRGWNPEVIPLSRKQDRNVLVIGAGPAGMECATVLGKRGLENVHLVDSADDIGGHVRWISGLPGMGAWGRVTDWRKTQLAKLDNVQVITNTTLTPQEAYEYGADVVVVAIGAEWLGTGINGVTHTEIPGVDSSRPDVLTPEQLLRDGKPVPGRTVTVYDMEGYFMGPSIAEKLQREGHEVTLLTRFGHPGPYMDLTGENVHMRPLLEELGVTVVAEHVLATYEGGKVVADDHVAEGRTRSWDADAIVLCTQRRARTDYFKSLRDLHEEAGDSSEIQAVYQIGDCVAPRMLLADAVFDGARLAREIDEENPAVPLPWIRERRLMGATDETYAAVLNRPEGR
ncbi:NAD(P)-binding protein [Nocardioides cavernae]|uniref:NAD(P)-binding protein n=1 Tax=Nocardioides cavernae TaxID=1921566 RepID=A0ABR8N7V3_9ACTN|nr:FAD-dependent oxidoreductase [Nocardioides cavernae]MBD3924227.1 NAD(P)-binding protein [Nocardioides cavernae]MBM7510834.1 dimethylamine/trimethylamine dehydrogenase [Nocardioides cavernae]